MPKTTLNEPWMHTEALSLIFKALDNQLRFVGGCVRNALLGQAVSDIDLTTPFSPDDVIERLEHHHIKVIPTGITHGTVTAIIDHVPFEITTLRKDTACDGRYATVEFTDSWEEDAARRDFTINAISCDWEGTLYDYFNGLKDITPPVIRFVGDAYTRCQEDYLRILRFFRFNAWYGKEINKEGMEACIALAKHIPTLSSERIWQEMRKLFAAPAPLSVISAIHETPIWHYVFGFESSLKRLEHYLTLESEHHLAIDPLARLAAIIKNSPSPEKVSKKISKQWRLSKQEAGQLQILATTTPSPEEAIVKELVRKHGNPLATKIICLSFSSKEVASFFSLVSSWQAPVFPLSGKDLIEQGYAPGKDLGELLKKAEEFWIKKGYTTDKRDLLLYIKGINKQL